MICPKCGSMNVNVQAVPIVSSRYHTLIWWLFIGWWWTVLKLIGWLTFGLLMLIPKLFIRPKIKIKTKVRSVAVCQNCGHKWNV